VVVTFALWNRTAKLSWISFSFLMISHIEDLSSL
jgi:hypothetical protein